MTDVIRIENLRETRNALRRADKDLAREFTKALKVVSTETADDARSMAQSTYGPFGGAARSIKGGAAGAKAYVKFGGANFPYARGAEFGGGKYGPGHPSPKGGHTSQFRPWRGNGADTGYAVFPTIRARQAGPNQELVERQLAQFIHSNNLG